MYVLRDALTSSLQAWFREDFVIPSPVVASADGSTLLPYVGLPLTVGGELNKIAVNVAAGRNMAGLHWRTDMEAAIKLGEDVAVAYLRDQLALSPGVTASWTFTAFDGTIKVINRN